MMYAAIEWTDPMSEATCRVAFLRDGSYTFDVLDLSGGILQSESCPSRNDALTRFARWRECRLPIAA